MDRAMDHAVEHSGAERIVDALTWQSAVRSDLRVAESLLSGASPDGVYGISHSRIVDHFLFFVEELGVGEALRGLQPVGVKRKGIPGELYTALYFLRCLARIPSQEALPDLLFSDTALMLRLGFNAHQIEMGITQRSAARRKGPRTNAPVDPEAISKNVAKLDLDAVRALVTLALKALWAAHPVVSPKGLFVIDGSFVEPGESTEGTGKTSRSKAVFTTEGMKTIKTWIIGFKIVWLWSVETGLPVAIGFGTAERDERAFVPDLLKQAKEVLADRCTIGTVLLDRGFLDGPDLWALNEAGIRFVIPARHDLKVYEEAHRAVDNEVPTHILHRQSRTRAVRHRPEGGRGKLVTEQHTTEAVGMEGCTTFTTYAPADDVDRSEHKHRYRRDFVPPKINAVVLTREDGRKNVDLTLLTNGAVSRPLAAFDDYDERSRIENQGHRDLKQFWHLERPPQRNAKVAEIHAYFVLLAYGLTQGYRAWLDAQVRAEDAGKPQSLGGYVRQIEAENKDKLLIFVGDAYGIFYSCEFSMLLGRPVRQPNLKAAPNIDALMERLRATKPKG